MEGLVQILRVKESMYLLERQQWKNQIMKMGHALQQCVVPEGVSKRHLSAGNVMTRLWMAQLCSSIGAESTHITSQEQEAGAAGTVGNEELHTV